MIEARVVLVRHGQTTWNRTRFIGRRDIPLDDVGRRQAITVSDLVAAWFLPGAPVVLWSSPLQRATATIAPLAESHGLPVHVHPDLVELDCGAWEGRVKAEVARKISMLPADEPVPGGESARDVAERLARFVADADLTTPTGTVVVLGHHLVNKVLRAVLLGRELDGALAAAEYRPRPGSVVALDHDGDAWVRPADASVPV